jgi:succinyl-diaminopimelate desuccinylase
VLKAIDVFRQIEILPFARESSELFDRPSINLGRIVGGDALNKVPDLCAIDVDVRYLPGQDHEAILGDVQAIPDTRLVQVFHRPPVIIERENRFVQALDWIGLDAYPGTVFPPVEATTADYRDGMVNAMSTLRCFAGIPGIPASVPMKVRASGRRRFKAATPPARRARRRSCTRRGRTPRRRQFARRHGSES